MNNLGSDIIIKKQFQLEELQIYGISRHGIHKPKTMLLQNTYRFNNLDRAIDIKVTTVIYNYFKRTLTLKQYELTNHLGNVMATVLDRKTFVQDSTGADTLLYYKADISTATLYYAFGSAIQELSYSSDTTNKYRFGFNGMEKENESFTDAYDFGARIYDGRLGRWLALDPLMNKYPNISPYVFCLNSVLNNVDLDGKEPIKAGVVSLSDMITTLRAVVIKEYKTCGKECEYTITQGIESLSDLRTHFGSGILGYALNGDSKKYLYSKKWGWIDMKHVSYAAALTDNIFISGQQVLNLGEKTEYNQENSIFPNNNDESKLSAWDYEDLVSNLIGVGFESYLETDAAEGKDILTNLNNYLNELGFGIDPNKKDENEISPTDELAINHSAEKGITNYTYDPINAPDKDKRTTDTDKKVIEIQVKREETTGKDVREYQINENT